MGGISHCTGLVEMKHDGQWRPANDWNWNQKTASVLCRQLGCGTAVSTQRTSGSSHVPVWLNRLPCDGSETSMRWCRRGDEPESFTTSKRLEVICSGKTQCILQLY